MRVITLARKSCDGSTTSNVVEYEAGALNIDGCRVGTAEKMSFSRAAPYHDNEGHQGRTWNPTSTPGMEREQHQGGRWPGNVLLLHRPGCEQTGTVSAPGYTINRWKDGAKPFGGGAGHEYESEDQPDEQVMLWACVDDCAVGSLQALRTTVTGVRSERSQGAQVEGTRWFVDNHQSREYPNELGVASRYFKQMQELVMNELPPEMWDYLYTLVAPPPECDPLLIVEADLDTVDFSLFEDKTVHGLITMGNPEKYLEEIDRVLRPGAHLLIIGDDEEPTGHTGACAVEEFGYEIRDAIAVFDTPGEFHYVAKASSSERNAGILARESETGRLVQNDHPTVKSVGIMEALLHDVSEGAVVVDPFMGSGTTGIACLRTNHSFIGIEQDAEYIKIADQRLRHWDRAEVAWNAAKIESEAVIEEDDEPMSLGDLFGMD